MRWWPIISALLLVALFASQAAAQNQIGRLTKLRGIVIIERGGHSLAAAPATKILLGDKLQTAAAAEATITLADGSELTLSGSSEIIIDRSLVGPTAADPVVNLFKGKLRSVITPLAGTLPEFEVHTPNAVAGVRGTDFETEYIEGRPCPRFPQCLRYTDVGVYRGVVEVRNPTSVRPISVRVTGGYETTVPCALPPATPGPLGIGDLSAPGYH
jgi:ferric-dicitrate binding protein FerR (iron transport regulator)